MPIELRRKITIRVTPEVYARLAAAARETQRTVSDIVRLALKGLPIRPRRRDGKQDELIRQLIRVGNNLLCLAAHKRFYVEWSVMWSWLTKARRPPRGLG